MLKRKCLPLLSIILGLNLTSCGSITVKDSRLCAVAGRLQAGANCTHTLTPETEEMTFDEFIDFLEPGQYQSEKRTIDKGAAMCMSAEDFLEQKTTLEKLCIKLGNNCTYEIKEAIKSITGNVQSLQNKSLSQKEQK